MLSLQVAFKETTGPPSSDGLMAGVGGVGHVGLCTISRDNARRETSAGQGTDRKCESLPCPKTKYQEKKSVNYNFNCNINTNL